MSADIGPLIEMYRRGMSAKSKAEDTYREASSTAAEAEAERIRQSAILSALVPLLHRLEGGSAAMAEADKEMSGSERAQLKGHAKQPGQSAVPMAALAEGPPARVTPIKAPPKPPTSEPAK